MERTSDEGVERKRGRPPRRGQTKISSYLSRIVSTARHWKLIRSCIDMPSGPPPSGGWRKSVGPKTMARFEADIWLIFSCSRTLQAGAAGKVVSDYNRSEKGGSGGNALVKVGHKVLERGIIGVWQLVDLLVQADMPQPVIVEPGGLHEGAKLAVGEERVRQLAEPELERARNDVDVGVGVVVLEVDGRNVYGERGLMVSEPLRIKSIGRDAPRSKAALSFCTADVMPESR
jgi:hypothetical protein